MTFSNWIQEQYDDLERLLPSKEIVIEEQILNGMLELLEWVSQYEKFKSPTEYIASRITMELSHYCTNLRFGRWLKIRKVSKNEL